MKIEIRATISGDLGQKHYELEYQVPNLEPLTYPSHWDHTMRLENANLNVTNAMDNMIKAMAEPMAQVIKSEMRR